MKPWNRACSKLGKIFHSIHTEEIPSLKKRYHETSAKL